MVNLIKLIRVVIFILVCIFFAQSEVAAQVWKQIVPLESDCESVKKALHIDSCQFPFMRIEDADRLIYIEFSQGDTGQEAQNRRDCPTVKSGVVLSVSVSLKRGIRLVDFASDFDDYVIVEVPDLPDSLRLVNKKLGVELSVINYPEVKTADLARYLKDPRLGHDILSQIAIQNVIILPSAGKCKPESSRFRQ